MQVCGGPHALEPWDRSSPIHQHLPKQLHSFHPHPRHQVRIEVLGDARSGVSNLCIPTSSSSCSDSIRPLVPRLTSTHSDKLWLQPEVFSFPAPSSESHFREARSSAQVWGLSSSQGVNTVSTPSHPLHRLQLPPLQDFHLQRRTRPAVEGAGMEVSQCWRAGSCWCLLLMLPRAACLRLTESCRANQHKLRAADALWANGAIIWKAPLI